MTEHENLFQSHSFLPRSRPTFRSVANCFSKPERYTLPTLAENFKRLFGFPQKYIMAFKVAAGESRGRFVAGSKVLSTSVAVLTILLG